MWFLTPRSELIVTRLGSSTCVPAKGKSRLLAVILSTCRYPAQYSHAKGVWLVLLAAGWAQATGFTLRQDVLLATSRAGEKARSVPVSPRLGPDAEGTGADVSDRPALDTLSLALGGTPSLGARMAVAEAFMRAAAQPTSEPVCKSIAEPNLVLYLQHCGLKGRSHTPEFVCLVVVTVHEKMLHLLLLLPCLLQLLPSNKLTLGLEFLGKVGASGSMPQLQSSSAPFFAKSSTPPPSTGLGPFSGGLRLSGDHSRSFLGGRAHGSGDAVRSSPLARSTCAVGGVAGEGASIMLQAPTSAAIPKSAFAAALDSRPGWPPLHTELGGGGRTALGPFSGLLCADPGLPKPSVPSCLNISPRLVSDTPLRMRGGIVG